MAEPDRKDGVIGDKAEFPATRWSLVLEAQTRDETVRLRAMSELCALYWYPLYAFVRRKGYSAHDAEDLTQGFLCRLISREHINAVDPEKGKLRSYLLTGVKNFLLSDWKKRSARKRGTGVQPLSIEGELAEQRYKNEPVDNETPETLFKRKWAMTLLDNTMKSLGAEYADSGREELFEEIKDFLAKGTSRSSYADAAGRLGITEGAVKVNVFRMRKRFQRVLRDEIAQTVASEEEVEDELRELHSAFA